MTNLQGQILTNSHPGKLDWQQWFAPGQYAENFSTSGQENFLNPGLTNNMGIDSQTWYYCFYPTAPWFQKGSITAPKTYWLAVYATNGGAFQYGWKTTFAVSNDISVHAAWSGNPGTNNPGWMPTYRPAGASNAPVDLAFKITTDTNYNNVLKYIQWPSLNITNAGYDVWNSSTKPPGVNDGPWVLADDFICTNYGYITDIHIWGSWYYDSVATNQTTFWVGLFYDVPAVTNTGGQVISNSHPGSLFWSECFPPGTYDENYWLPASEGFLDPGTPTRVGSDFQAWYYSFTPTNPPLQKGSVINPATYWLGVFAQLPPVLQSEFGWKTTTNVQHDISVHSPWLFGQCPANIPASAFAWTPTHADSGPMLDLAFEISTITNCSETYLTIDRMAETNVVVTWPSGILQWSTNVIGPYTDVGTDLGRLITSPFTNTACPPPPTNRFYRVRCN